MQTVSGNFKNDNMTLASNNLFYLDGYQVALANAQALSKVADKSAEENEFGIASSLKILSAEETIKAVALLTIHFKIEDEVAGLEKIFRDHKTKHEILAESSVMLQALVDIAESEYGVLDYVFETLEKLSGSNKEEVAKLAAIFTDNLGWIRKAKNSDIKNEEAKKWWAAANLQKNRGFYVDMNNDSWHTPKDFTEQQYLEAREHTDLLIANAIKLAEIYERQNPK
jgi:AbiV family abortive infection protein